MQTAYHHLSRRKVNLHELVPQLSFFPLTQCVHVLFTMQKLFLLPFFSLSHFPFTSIDSSLEYRTQSQRNWNCIMHNFATHHHPCLCMISKSANEYQQPHLYPSRRRPLQQHTTELLQRFTDSRLVRPVTFFQTAHTLQVYVCKSTTVCRVQ